MKSDLPNFDSDISRDILKASVTRKFRAGEQIFGEGDEATFLPIVSTGRVKLVRYPEVGKEVILGMFQAGDVFAIPPALDGKQFPATAVAMETTELLMLPRVEFLRLMGTSREFSTEIMARMCGLLRKKADTLQILATPSAERRVASVLLSLAGEIKPDEPQRISHRRQDIAEMAGLTTETTIRAIRKLADRGLLKIVRGKIVLDSTDDLQKFVG
jgi:CRP/FNR family transcriptional regulator